MTGVRRVIARVLRRRDVEDVTDGGFTMTEMLVAMFMIAVGLLAMVGELVTVLHTHNQQKLRAQALRMASASVEDARNSPITDLINLAGTYVPTTVKGFTEKTVVTPCSASDTSATCTATSDPDKAAVRVSVDVSWKDGTKQRHVTIGTSVTNDAAKNIAASGSTTNLLGGSATSGLSVTLGTLSLSPTAVAVNASTGVSLAPVTASISVVGLGTATSFPVTWTDDTGSHQATATLASGSTYSVVIPAGQITRNVQNGSVVFSASIPGSKALPTATLATVKAPAFSGTCTVNPAVIVLRLLTTVSSAATTLSCSTTGLAASDSVKVSWPSATGTKTATMTSSTGSAWSVVLPSGTQMQLLTETFTFTPTRASDGASGTPQSVTAVVG